MSNTNGQSSQPVYYNSQSPQLPPRKKPKNFLLSVHVVPIIMGILTIIVPFVIGIIMFNIANSDSGTRPAAPIAGIAGFVIAFIYGSMISAYIVSLAYLIFRLSSKFGMMIFQVSITVVTGAILMPMILLGLKTVF